MKAKCNVCNKKISIIEQSMQCKCNGTFCSKHNFPEKHDCIEIKNDKQFFTEQLIKMKCVSDKIIKI